MSTMTARVLVAVLSAFGLPFCGGSIIGNPKPAPSVKLEMSSISNSSVTSLAMCISGISLVPSGSDASPVSVSPTSQNVLLSPTDSTLIANLSSDGRSYQGVNVVMDPVCVSKESMALTNGIGAGNYSTTDSIEASFVGDFKLSGSIGTIVLDLTSISGQLATVQSDAQIPSAVQAAPGGISSFASIALVQSREIESLTYTTVKSIPITYQAGDFLAFLMVYSATSVSGFTDSAGNVFQSTGSSIVLNSGTYEIWYAENAVGTGSTLSVVLPTNSQLIIEMAEFSGVATSGSFGSAQWDSGNGGTTVSCPALDPPQTGSLMFAAAGITDSTTWSALAPYSLVPSTTPYLGVAYYVSGATGSSPDVFSKTGTLSWVCGLASFRPALE